MQAYSPLARRQPKTEQKIVTYQTLLTLGYTMRHLHKRKQYNYYQHYELTLNYTLFYVTTVTNDNDNIDNGVNHQQQENSNNISTDVLLDINFMFEVT